MIGEVVRKRGDRGSGGGAEAFEPGVAYICSKATLIAVMNLISDDWHHAGPDMVRTAALNTKVKRPYYHLILTWHPDEQPTAEQQFAAMCDMIEALGLGEHQAVIGTHDDKEHCHIHAAFNTVHPLTGKVWSKSNDHLRIEKACRAIELKYGWRHDNGRFDFEVSGEGDAQKVHLLPAPERWAQKQADRAAGKHKPSRTDIAFEKDHGLKSFGQSIPLALKEQFGKIVTNAQNWQDLHKGLAEIGLLYQQKGSGASVALLGSQETAKASAFGQAFTFARLQKRFGPYSPPLNNAEIARDHKAEVKNSIRKARHESAVTETEITAVSFKLTLLRRIYTNLYLDARVAEQIKYVEMIKAPPCISLKSGTEITDHGSQINATATDVIAIRIMVAMAKAKGWPAAVPTGDDEFIREFTIIATQEGLPVAGVPPEIQLLADRVMAEKLEDITDQLESQAQHTATGTNQAIDYDPERLFDQRSPSSHANLAAEAIFGTDEDEEARSPNPEPDLMDDMAEAENNRHENEGLEDAEEAPEEDDSPSFG